MRRYRLLFPPVAMSLLVSVLLWPAGCDDGQAPSDKQDQTSKTKTPGGPGGELMAALGTQGRVTLVQFASMGDGRPDVNLQRLDRIARNKAVVGLAVGRVELGRPKIIQAVFNQRGVKVPVVGEDAGKYAKALAVADPPACVLLDKGGYVHYRGAMPGEHLLAGWFRKLHDRPVDAGPPETLLDAAAADKTLLSGTELPELESGRNERLKSFIGRSGLVAVFVDTTCRFSGTALADVEGVSRELENFDVPVVVVNIGNPLEKVEQYYSPDNVHLHVPILYDTTSATRDRWKINRVPMVAYFRPDGMMTFRGTASWDELAKGIAVDLGVEERDIVFEQDGTSYG